ncbi:MAG: hypothetical protein GF311_15050 [Candidatus Lokiarchaeota archaeon]|nr:hypothetical protein [Candidatus Lokiarchaeota archaeon]
MSERSSKNPSLTEIILSIVIPVFGAIDDFISDFQLGIPSCYKWFLIANIILILLFWRRFPKRYRLLVLFLLILISIVIQYFAYGYCTRPPKSEASIFILIDGSLGDLKEEYDIPDRIKDAVEKELKELNIDSDIQFFNADYIKDIEERWDWASKGGANIIMGGTKDKGRIKITTKLCSSTFSEDDIFTGKVSLAKNNFDSISQTCFDNDIEVLRPEYKNDSYNNIMDQDIIECNVVENDFPKRTQYILSYLMGMIFLYEDIPQIETEKEIVISKNFFERALKIGDETAKFDLPYCGIYIYQGYCAIESALTSGKANRLKRSYQQSLNLINKAISCRRSRSILDEHYVRASIDKIVLEAMKIKGQLILKYAGIFDPQRAYVVLINARDTFDSLIATGYKSHIGYAWKAKAYFNLSLLEYYNSNFNISQALLDSTIASLDEGMKLEPFDYFFYFKKATYFSIYAKLRNDIGDEEYFNKIFDLFSESIQVLKIKNNNETAKYEIYFNWAQAHYVYARRINGKKALNSFEKAYNIFEKAELLNSSDPQLFYVWGNALFHCAQKCPDDNLRQQPYYFELGNKKFEKAANLCIKGNFHTVDLPAKIYNQWGNMLLSYASRCENEKAKRLVNSAIEKFKKSLLENPDRYKTTNNLGFAYHKLALFYDCRYSTEYYDSSFLYFSKAIEHKNDIADVYISWAYSLNDYLKCFNSNETIETIYQEIKLRRKTGFPFSDYYRFLLTKMFETAIEIDSSGFSYRLREYNNLLNVDTNP